MLSKLSFRESDGLNSGDRLLLRGAHSQEIYSQSKTFA